MVEEKKLVPEGEGVPHASKVQFESFTPSSQGKEQGPIELLKDIPLNVKIELGRARMYVQDVLKLTPGSIVEMDKLTGDPLDLYANDKLVARGEILVINDNFAIRITEIVSSAKSEEK